MPAVGRLVGAVLRASRKHDNIPVSRFAHSSHIDLGAGGMAAHILNCRWAGRPIFMLW